MVYPIAVRSGNLLCGIILFPVSSKESATMFLKLMLMMAAGLCVVGAVLVFAFPEVLEAVKTFDWSKIAEAIIRQFGF